MENAQEKKTEKPIAHKNAAAKPATPVNAEHKKAQVKPHTAQQVQKKEKKVKEKVKKIVGDKKTLKIRELLKRKSHPVFRGRFGNRKKRSRSIEKWDKWRLPRGIDISFKNDDGRIPRIGYRVPKALRHIHPSGFREMTVSTSKQISEINGPEIAIRFAAGIGKRKRVQMLKVADGKNLKVLNRWKR